MQQLTFSISKQEDALLLILLGKRLGAMLIDQKNIEQIEQIVVPVQETEVIKKLPDSLLDDLSDDELSFEQWNEQFEGEQDLSEHLPDFDMTIGDFRKKIWRAETEDSFMTLAEFTDELKTWNS